MATRNRGAIAEIHDHRGSFAAAFVVIFLLSYLFLMSVGATPDPIHPSVHSEPVVSGSAPASVSNSPEVPVRIIASEIGLDATIANPSSVDVDVLDEALMNGAVRYPTSAMLGVDGTVLLFGHSSYLPVVHNQAYKTFDDIQKLKPGQTVSVYSGGTEYRYAVVQVKAANANDDSIELNPVGKHLTLVTCNSFATKSDRFVVTADFVGAYSLASN
ncbi:MAG TPA: sortase [Candidatus Paceibacterota bacterium]|nr:sortase [Candidatus Paceibacterota bacterium]